MFDLGQENYLIAIPPTQPQTKASTQLVCQTPQHLGEEEDRKNKDKKDRRKESCKHGKWTLRQKMRYLLFLEEYMELFADTQVRKKSKVFAKMSKHVKSRRTSQCKSHHQKALKIHKNENNIVAFLRRNLNPLKAEWSEFIRTQDRVLLNTFPEINKNQSFYKIFQYTDTIKIEINTNHMESYL